MGERARNVGVSRTWSVIVARRMFVGRILWTGKQPLDGWWRNRPEIGRLRDDRTRSTLFTLVLAWRCLHDTRRYAL